MESEKLIQILIEQTRQIMNRVEKLQQKDAAYLTWRHDPAAWNILECLEHLNLYGDYYLPAIEKAIHHSATRADTTFTSGMLGSYFTKSMSPKDKLNKMKTFKDKNPLNAVLDKSVIERFMAQQFKMLELLNKARNISLNKVKISTSISRLIKLKLGDTFQFIMQHNLRHLQQIERIEQQLKNAFHPI